MDKDLQTLYLKLDSSAQSLSKIALSQLVLKIIYASNQNIKISTIRKRITALLKTQISLARVDDAITLLIEDNKIYKSDHYYSISKLQSESIDNSLRNYNERMDRILSNYFSGAESSKNDLREWIMDVTIEVLSLNKSGWMDARVKKKAIFGLGTVTDQIIESITLRNSVLKSEDKNWLIKRYSEFLKSGDDDMVSLLWDFGTSAFCSELITASTGVDQFTIDQITDTYFFLDTNILMYLQLEEGELYKSYKALETIFSKLSIKPCYFEITREEYIATMLRKQQLIMQVVHSYDREIISELNDEFVKTALSRQCQTVDDYNRFFDEIITPPKKFVDEIEIKAIDSPEIDEAISNGIRNEKLIEQLNSIFRRLFYRESRNRKQDQQRKIDLIPDFSQEDKNITALEHDAGIISGTSFCRKTKKCFILTRDKTLKTYCQENTIRNEPPIAISLDALISSLAVDNGGVDIDPTDFKPLFANIVKGDLIPERETFQIEDLAKMLEVEEQFKELPPEEIKDIAHEVYRMRLKDANGEKTSLFLTRRFQSAKLKFREELNEANSTIKKTLKNNLELKDRETRSHQLLRKRIQSELRRKYIRIHILSNIAGSLAIAAVFIIIYVLIRVFFLAEQMTHDVVYTVINLLIGGLLNLFILFPGFRKKYRENLSNIAHRSEEQLEREILDQSKGEQLEI